MVNLRDCGVTIKLISVTNLVTDVSFAVSFFIENFLVSTVTITNDATDDVDVKENWVLLGDCGEQKQVICVAFVDDFAVVFGTLIDQLKPNADRLLMSNFTVTVINCIVNYYQAIGSGDDYVTNTVSIVDMNVPNDYCIYYLVNYNDLIRRTQNR